MREQSVPLPAYREVDCVTPDKRGTPEVITHLDEMGPVRRAYRQLEILKIPRCEADRCQLA